MTRTHRSNVCEPRDCPVGFREGRGKQEVGKTTEDEEGERFILARVVRGEPLVRDRGAYTRELADVSASQFDPGQIRAFSR